MDSQILFFLFLPFCILEDCKLRYITNTCTISRALHNMIMCKKINMLMNVHFQCHSDSFYFKNVETSCDIHVAISQIAWTKIL